MRAPAITILSAALIACCGPPPCSDDPHTYHATADASGWATVHHGHAEGALLDVDAWAIERPCEGCDPIVWHPVAHEFLPGAVRARVVPGVEVVFSVVKLGGGIILEEIPRDGYVTAHSLHGTTYGAFWSLVVLSATIRLYSAVNLASHRFMMRAFCPG